MAIGYDAAVLSRLVLRVLRNEGARGEWYDVRQVDLATCGELGEEAVRWTLERLVADGSVERREWSGEDEYRIAQPQEGESLDDKVKRLEAENSDLRSQNQRWHKKRRKLVDKLVRCRESCCATEANTRRLAEERDRLRAEQAADRTAVKALVDSLSRCEAHAGCENHATRDWDSIGERRFCCDEHDPKMDHSAYQKYLYPFDHAAPLRELQARMATWPSEGDSSFVRAMLEPSTDTLATVEALVETDRRYGLKRSPDEIAARFDAADPKWHRLYAELKRRYPKGAAVAETRETPHRYIGEFGDIDEPSVGDVDGYGRRG